MDVTAILVAIIGSGVLSTIINRFFSWLDSRNGYMHGLRLVLKDRLRFLAVRYIEQGWIYEDELEDIIAMHACYHGALKGNGYLDDLMNRVKALPIKGVGVK